MIHGPETRHVVTNRFGPYVKQFETARPVLWACKNGHVCSVHRPNNGMPRCFFCAEAVTIYGGVAER